MKAISADLRQRIVQAHEAGEGTQRQLAARFDVSLAFVVKLLHQWRETGSLDPKPHVRRGPAPRLDQAAQQLLQEQLAQQPDATLAELCALVQQQAGVQVTCATMCRRLQRLGLTRKKRVSTPAKETRRVSRQRGLSSSNSSRR